MSGGERTAVTCRPPMSEVSARLATDMVALAHTLFPAGRREGREYVIGGFDGSPGQSLRICVSGPKQGLWFEHAEGRGGDAIELIAGAMFGGNRTDAWHWACDSWLGLTGSSRAQSRSAVAAPPHRPEVSGDETTRRARQSERAFGVWLSARSAIRGTPVERYLDGTRGIPLARLGRQPAALRFHPELRAEERYWPAMVAVICGTGGGKAAPIGIHRTFLHVRADGSVGKAPIPAPKRVMGSMRGGIIPLWRGRSGKPLAQAPADDVLAITEGIEDALTVALAEPAWRVVAAVSIGNLAAIELPPALLDVVICADNDAAGSPAARALAAAVVRFQDQGRRVRLASPPEGVKDFNAMRTVVAA